MRNTQIPSLFFSMVFAACANSGDQPNQGDNKRPLQPPAGQTDQLGPDSADASLEAAGLVEFNLTQVDYADSLRAYIVGKAESRQAQRSTKTGSHFQIRNLPAGRYDIVFTAVDPASLSSNNPHIYGLRINGVQVSTDRPTQLGNIRLELSRDLVGSIQSIDGPLVSAKVEIAGTGFVAFSDNNGNYRIQGAPKGQHRLLVSKDGFHPGRMEQVRLEAGTLQNRLPVQLETLILWDDFSATGPAVLSAYSTQNPASQLSVPFVLLPPATANLMRISEQEDLDNADWQALQTSLRYTFSNPGNKTLYVQYSRDRSQLSPIVATELMIELP